MPSTFSFALLFLPSPAPGFSIIPIFPLGGGVTECDVEADDQAYFLALFDRTHPSEYMDPLKAYPDSGYEIFQGFAELGERLSLALERFECGSFIIFAEGGARALVTVELSRPTAAAGAVVVKAGTRVAASRSGREYVIVEDAVFGGADVGPVAVSALAVADGWEFNVPGRRITAGGEVLPGEIDEITSIVMDPPGGDFTFVVEQILDAEGGKAAMLDGLGENRGLRRLTGEGDDSYRLRIRSLPDTVSPAAMLRAIHRHLDPLGLEFDFCETFEHRYQECYDAPSPNAGTPTYDGGVPPANPLYNHNTFVYDDPRPVTTVFHFCRNRTMDEVERRGAIVVVVPNNVTFIDLGMAYDDPGMQPSDFRDPATGQQRGTSAYDVTSAMDPALVYPGAYDGFDFVRSAAYFALYQELQDIKPAGVAAIVETIRP